MECEFFSSITVVMVYMQTYHFHNSVLLYESVNSLNIRPNGIYLDGTFGTGGHSRLILSKLGRNGRLFAIDRDPVAVEYAKNIQDSRFTIIHGLFSSMKDFMENENLIGCVDGILLDLGMSALQIDNPERGFSFMRDGPLDMRMNVKSGVSAMDWLKTASIKDIALVLRNFGEEKFANRIARAIVNRTIQKPITRTHELSLLISKVYPHFYRKKKHPATRSFQAIRIYINNELEELQIALNSAVKVLSYSGRLSVISFHSLEDRIVKHFIRKYNYAQQALKNNSLITEDRIFNQPNICNKLKEVDKIRPSKEEISKNPRSRSAILRSVEKISYVYRY